MADSITDRAYRAWIGIDLNALDHNVARMRPSAAEFMAVVKADAYGHGVHLIAPRLRSQGVQWLGVALPSEARALRASGDHGSILAWLWAPGDPEIAACVENSIDLGVSSLDQLEAVARTGMPARIHLKIDTGLSRSGASAAHWEQLCRAALHAPHITVVGVWSHLARADEPQESTTDEQVARFVEALEVARAVGLDPQYIHIANSAGALWHEQTHFTMIRSGIALYGVSPDPTVATASSLDLRPVMSISARISLVKDLSVGDGVGYGHTWRATEPTRVALIPVGYADGIPRGSGNRAQIVVSGQRVPIIGTVAMDQFVVDLGDVPARPDDVVSILGGQGPSAEEWGTWSGTIGYEIVTRMGTRMPRIATALGAHERV